MSDTMFSPDWAPKSRPVQGKEARSETAQPPAAAKVTPAQLMTRDRSTPAWAAALSAMFTFGTALCYGALVIFALFLHQLVALEGIEIYAPVLGFSALVPVLGILVFEMGHAQALIGYPDLRRRCGPIGGLIAACLATGGLFMLHPLLALAPMGGALLGWVVTRPLARALPHEHAWKNLPEEAASVLSGRDQRGLDLLWQATRRPPAVDALMKAVVASTFIAGFTLASWLTMREVLTPAAITPVALITLGITVALMRFWQIRSYADPEQTGRARSITLLPERQDLTVTPDSGLWVDRLSVSTADGQRLLHDLSFHLPVGSMVALVGDSFSGKSLLMKALSAPHDLTDLEVQGLVQLNGLQPWDRNTEVQAAAAVYLPPRPLIIPDSGQANLMHPTGEMARRAEYLLKSLLHNADTTQRILNCRNATQLSHSEQKALGFVRAVCLRPSLYLLDRPEDGCPEMLRSTLLTRLRDEVRRGATVLVATEDRAMLEACDQLINLQNGRLVEMAPAAEMRARASAGWQRFVAPCELESEDALDSWINAQFRRDGDGANRRAVCMVANEMLTLACRTDMPSAIQSVCFEIKLFAGQCVLRMRQAQPLSSGALERAATQARGDAPLTDTPLARIVRDSLSVENTRPDNQHWLEVAIAIYDPRKANNTPPSAEAKPDAQTAD